MTQHAMKVALGVAIAAALGAVALTIWVGAQVKEETVVGNPYEDGLRVDADARARARLGWDVAVAGAPAEPGPATIAFAVADRAGRPVEGASVTVSAERPDTSRGVRAAQARAEGPGRYAVPLALDGPGPWLLRFDVRRGEDRVRIEKAIEVGTACELGAGSCTRPLPGGGEVTLALGPHPLRTMVELDVAADVRVDGRPVEGAAVAVAFSMPGMEMGRNAPALAARGAGRYAARAVLVRCPSGRRDWLAEVTVTRPGRAPQQARFSFRVAE